MIYTGTMDNTYMYTLLDGEGYTSPVVNSIVVVSLINQCTIWVLSTLHLVYIVV
jgi:hypothetical protein